jgi:hypothetical protein
MAEQPDPSRPSEQPAETQWQRRRRLAAVFGDVLPDTTSDERSPEPVDEHDDEHGDELASDAWLRAQVPPHHG